MVCMPRAPLADLHLRVDLVDLLVAHEVADGRGGEHHLDGERAAGAVATADELLRHHRLEDQRQLRADLRLLVRREDVDDAGEGLHGGAGVQGREDEMAGLRDGERRLDGLAVAHLADQHDVGVLAQHVLQRRAKPSVSLATSRCVTRQRLGLVQELDGVFQRDDVVAALAVHLVDQGGERGALAAARRRR